VGLFGGYEEVYRICRNTLNDVEKKAIMSLLENLSSQNTRLDSKQMADKYSKILPYSAALERTGAKTHLSSAQVFGLLLMGHLHYLNEEWQMKDVGKGKVYTKL
jgi:hypothetical protein